MLQLVKSLGATKKNAKKKMPPKIWLVLLFWLQSAFAQSSFFGAAADFPFFSSFKPSGLPKQPLVHVSKHGRGREEPDRIDIV